MIFAEILLVVAFTARAAGLRWLHRADQGPGHRRDRPGQPGQGA